MGWSGKEKKIYWKEMMNLDTANSHLIQKIERVLHYEIRWKAIPMSITKIVIEMPMREP